MRRAAVLLLLALGIAFLLLLYLPDTARVSSADDEDCFFAGQWICH